MERPKGPAALALAACEVSRKARVLVNNRCPCKASRLLGRKPPRPRPVTRSAAGTACPQLAPRT